MRPPQCGQVANWNQEGLGYLRASAEIAAQLGDEAAGKVADHFEGDPINLGRTSAGGGELFLKYFCEQMRGTSGRVKECKSSTDERFTTWACTVETTMLLSNAAARLKLGACETMPLPDSRAVRQR